MMEWYHCKQFNTLQFVKENDALDIIMMNVDIEVIAKILVK